MDPIKEAFSKIKTDIEFLNTEIGSLKNELTDTREELIKICEILINLSKKIDQSQKKEEKPIPAHQHITQTTPTHIPAHNLPLNGLKGQNKPFSNGNKGVPTDRQTDRQTDRFYEKRYIPTHQNTQNQQDFQKESLIKPQENAQNTQKYQKNTNFDENAIDNAAKILDSLDSIKKEIRLKFKRLTQQEMLVFSTLYQLEEEQGEVDYKVLAERLKLTESSVRDYIGKLIKKGIPVDKKRVNNKTILLSVSSNLKKITSLSTILQLRDL